MYSYPHKIFSFAFPTMEVEEDATKYLELPQEMSEHIMSFLQYDFMALKLCSLVCRSWTMAARRFLFRILVIEDKKSSAGISTFAITSGYCKIIPYVKGIEIRCAGRIDALIWKSPDSLLNSLSSTITCLRLFKCLFNNFLDLTNAIQMFCCVQDLGLECVDWKVSDVVGSFRPTTWSPSSLTHLRLKSTQVAPVLNGMIASTEPLRISHFEVNPMNEEDIPIFCKFCQAVGKTLKSMSTFTKKREVFLSYIPYSGPTTRRDAENVDNQISNLYTSYFNIPRSFPIFTSLERVRAIKFLDSSSSNEQETGMFWAARVLTKIHPQHVFKYMTLQLVISRTGEVDHYGIRWDFFDEALGSDIFVNFRYLEFEVLGKVELDTISSLLSHRLPRLAARGRLRFSKLE